MTATDRPDNDVTLRPIRGRDELALFQTLPYVLNEEQESDLDAGRRRPEWLWMALRGDRLLARLAWWAPGPDRPPALLDTFDIDDDATDPDLAEVALALLRTARGAVSTGGAGRMECLRFVPADWHDDPAVHRAVSNRIAILERAGASLFVERLGLEWSPGAGVPEPSGRLTFRPVADRADLVGLMTRVLHGTLDAYSRDDLTRATAEQAANAQYDDELARYPSPRDWWKVAELPGGEPVGFVVPARNAYNAIIAYLGVLPEHRGHGYIDDILAEGTRVLAANDVPRIRANTDVGNVPMANAFARAGYRTHNRRLDFLWH